MIYGLRKPDAWLICSPDGSLRLQFEPEVAACDEAIVTKVPLYAEPPLSKSTEDRSSLQDGLAAGRPEISGSDSLTWGG